MLFLKHQLFNTMNLRHKRKKLKNLIKEIKLKKTLRTPNNQLLSVQSLSRVRLFATPWTATCQASLTITNSQSLLRLMSIELVMPPNHLILCHPLLLLPSIFPSIRVFSNESVLRIRWLKYWNFNSVSVLLMNVQD